MSSIFKYVPKNILKKRVKKVEPSFIQPMLATLTTRYFSNKNWLYEHKFDGERCLVFKRKGNVTLMSRNKRIINAEYPELVAALLKQKADNFIIDGEIIARDASGISDFQLLQGRINVQKESKITLRKTEIQICYQIFDLMYVENYDIREFPLYIRKKLLQKLLNYNKVLLYTDHIVGDGIPFFKKACEAHWEGLIAKQSESIYTGTRSSNWLKFKCIMKQELVIGGYTSPKGSRTFFGALLVGYYEKGKLLYAGKVGTGYSEETLTFLGKKLQKLEVKRCPFSNYNESETGIHWVKPLLVAEFQFAQWTNAGKLRVGRYKGLRDDKDAKDVVKEVPKLFGPTHS